MNKTRNLIELNLLVYLLLATVCSSFSYGTDLFEREIRYKQFLYKPKITFSYNNSENNTRKSTNVSKIKFNYPGKVLNYTNKKNFCDLLNINEDELKEIREATLVGATLQDKNSSTAIARINGNIGAVLFDHEITKILLNMGCSAQVTAQGTGFANVYFNQNTTATFTGSSFSNPGTHGPYSPKIIVSLNGITYQYLATGAAIPANGILIFRGQNDTSQIFSLTTISAISANNSGTAQAISLVPLLNLFLPNGATVIGNGSTISSAYAQIMSAGTTQTNVSGVFSGGIFINPTLSNATIQTIFNGSSFSSNGNTVQVVMGGDTFTYTVPNGSSSSVLNSGSSLVFNNSSNTQTFTITTNSQIASNSSDALRASVLTNDLNDYFANGSQISANYTLPNYGALQTSYDNLQTTYNALVASNAILTSQNSTLTSQNATLTSTLNNLNSIALAGTTNVSGVLGSASTTFSNIACDFSLTPSFVFNGSSFTASGTSVNLTINGVTLICNLNTQQGETTSGTRLTFLDSTNSYHLTLTVAGSTIGLAGDTDAERCTKIATALNVYFINGSTISGGKQAIDLTGFTGNVTTYSNKFNSTTLNSLNAETSSDQTLLKFVELFTNLTDYTSITITKQPSQSFSNIAQILTAFR